MFTTKTEMGYGLMTAPTATSATCRFRLFPLVVFLEKSFRVPKNRLRLIVRAHWAR